MVEVRRNPGEELETRVNWKWPRWEKEVFRFIKGYDTYKWSYFHEGEEYVVREMRDIYLGASDFVKFAKGIDCDWNTPETLCEQYFLH